MNVLILAAGYATRLYPLTLNKAKPLLEVAGKPMIEWVLDNLAPIPDIRTVYVVTNDKFAQDFEGWAERYGKTQPKVKFKIVNDGSRSDADKLGAIGDIRLVLHREQLTREPLIVVAGDNLFSEPLEEFAAHA
ncbi:MAG TPA: sugar phosphate nucleotidyltransferase, partial [Chthoniobacterales bacterium]